MDADFIHDLFADFGRVEVKRMFGGQGIYAGGVIFAIVSGDVIYLKTDETTRPAFEREHATALTFTKKSGQRMVTSYWRLPERLYDAPDELAQWARQALAVARTNKAREKPAKKSAKKPGKKLGKKLGKRKAGRKARL
ncbi:MAG: TfoX/Sxy family protein [Hyphomicrobiales bacterium]|nr:TfoX/Sxy family protein [Hyphomicrobiales bacterium]